MKRKIRRLKERNLKIYEEERYKTRERIIGELARVTRKRAYCWHHTYIYACAMAASRITRTALTHQHPHSLAHKMKKKKEEKEKKMHDISRYRFYQTHLALLSKLFNMPKQ